MRVRLSHESLTKLYAGLQDSDLTANEIAHIIGVHPRTLKDWGRGKHLMSFEHFCLLADKASIQIDELTYELVDERARFQAAGRMGGAARYKKHGAFGSKKDKAKGGAVSYSRRKHIAGSMFERKAITQPRKSVELAEFIGICMGDGSLTPYQQTISLNSVDDAGYVEYVAELGERLFVVKPTISTRKTSQCMTVVYSGRELVECLIHLGLPLGDKIRAGLDIPQWILHNKSFTRGCVRGLFDTDGCIYLEIHRRKNGSVYQYPRMSFVSSSSPLRASVLAALHSCGIGAKERNKRSVSIERFTDIEKYFKLIGSSNQKHLDRFAQFGGVG